MSGTPANRLGFSPLFGNYFLELQKFLAKFRTYKRNEQGEYEEITPLVLMGSPSAAFRQIFPDLNKDLENTPRTINRQPNLPVINFIAVDFRRIFSQENAYGRFSLNLGREDENGRPVSTLYRAPQHWEVNYQVSVWTDGYKQRDDLLSRILSAFRGGTVGLIFYPDKVEHPDVWGWFEYTIDEQITDETNQEELNEKEGRKFVRTTFILRGKSTLDYDMVDIPLIKSIEVANKEWRERGETFRFDIVEVNGEEIIVLNPNPFPINI